MRCQRESKEDAGRVEYDGICLPQPIRDGQMGVAKQHFTHQGVKQLLHVWPQRLRHSSAFLPRPKSYRRLASHAAISGKHHRGSLWPVRFSTEIAALGDDNSECTHPPSLNAATTHHWLSFQATLQRH